MGIVNRRSFSSRMLFAFLLFCSRLYIALTQGVEGYFNGSSYVSLFTTIDVHRRTSLSFRTCSSGQLLYQEDITGNFVDLSLLSTGTLELKWKVNGQESAIQVGSNLIDNRWHNVDLMYHLGTSMLSVDRDNVVVASSNNRSDFFSLNFNTSPSNLVVGRQFVGCILQGAGVVLNTSALKSYEVNWGKCPLPDRGGCDGYQIDHCFSQPCHKYSKCLSLPNGFECICTTRYTGQYCDIDLGPLCNKREYNQCRNGGVCQEDKTGNSTFCACLPTFTGAFCETMIDHSFCNMNPCRNGGSCNINKFRNNYICKCPQGFAGDNCELNIDECQSSPCQNNGTCTDEINSYTCDCTSTGYRGANCEININECEENNPCYTGSACFDRYGDYICDCPRGFGGKNCDQEVNECDSNPCLNGGSCNNNPSGYLCHCATGFAGINCEINVDDCAGVFCPNNSYCVDGIGSFSCVCSPGYSGAVPHCVEIDECASRPCHNGGSCMDLLNDFVCNCADGFTGRFCETNVNECFSNPCLNGATCIDGTGKYTCHCAVGYTGTNCDVDINDCDPNPCLNSARCSDLVNGYFCHCLPGWEGPICTENIDECKSQPCLHGSCVDLQNNFSCSCEPGYSGRLCEENINDCDSSPCFNGGICTDLVNDFSCRCLDDFMGKTCSESYNACHSSPCMNNGTCRTNIPSHEYFCICPLGFIGSRCEVNIDECEGVVCPKGQVCFDLQNAYECRCPIGFDGPDCSININECSSNPCVNGTCVDGIGNYACQCPNGLTGKHCESDINECDDSPCIHGICQNFHGSYQCFCRPGFTGMSCSLEINECLSAPCKNSATCNDLINDYNCTCHPGFTGRNCEVDINECASDPCQNGGTCTDMINKYVCNCVAGFSGVNCEINIDECASLPCLNGGSCVDLINGFECNCTDSGFFGDYCEENINDCESNPCQNGATCNDGVKDYDCDCYDGYSGKNCENDEPECESSPCLNNALCLENSNQTLYEINYLGFFTDFSYAKAAGYKCICSLGFTGVNCETNIDDCVENACGVYGACIDGINSYHCQCNPGYEGVYCSIEIDECQKYDPCKNGATCSDLIADYSCECLPEYGDKNCSTLLKGCYNHQCMNGATCIPYLTEENHHNYNCVCPQGYHGVNCEKPTTVSFNGNGKWTVNQTNFNSENYVLNFYFRTTLPNGWLVHGMDLENYLEYAVYLYSGLVHLSVFNDTGIVLELKSRVAQNDSLWKHVKLSFGDFISLNVSGEEISVENPFPIVSFSTWIGSVNSFSPFNISTYHTDISGFIGCIQDVSLNEEVMIPSVGSNVVNGEIGCIRKDQCEHSPCSAGQCIDKWFSFICECSRPYFGKHCEYSHKPATFGYKDEKSSASLNISDENSYSLSLQSNVTFFLRTRNKSGLLFYLGSPMTSNQMYIESSIMSPNAFMMARLIDGKLQVLLKLDNGQLVELNIDNQLDDGNYHFIQVIRNMNILTIKADDVVNHKNIEETPFIPRVLYIAGLPEARRQKRQLIPNNFNYLFSSYTFENISYFKGVLQDFRVNNMIVTFFPLEAEANLTGIVPIEFGAAVLINVKEGVISDNLCEPVNPCQQNALCNDTWNDYECTCPKGYRGKNCEERKPCSYNTCPLNSLCQDLKVGYECVAAASFNGKSSEIHYTVQDINRNVTNITFSFRSINTGTVLRIENNQHYGRSKYFLHVELFNDSLEVNWNLGPSETILHKTVSRKINRDKEWHKVKITFEGNSVQLQLDEEKPNLSEDINTLTLSELLNENADIYLGYNPRFNSNFKGCLDEVRIGSILLPFFDSSLLPNTSTPFYTKTMQNIIIGCVLCYDEDCVHGVCEDHSDSYNCHCPGGYKGQFCEIDLCISENPCYNDGKCYHDNDKILCNCTEFFTGPNCTQENRCASSPCLNGGVCTPDPERDDFYCNCSSIYEGKMCEKPKILDCTVGPCEHGECIDLENINEFEIIKYMCRCFDGYEGQNCSHIQDFCKSNPCGNNGECIVYEGLNFASYRCDCNLGYTGVNCESEINECINHECLFGECIDGIGSYTCKCFPGYRGPFCEEGIKYCDREGTVCYNGVCNNSTDDGYVCRCYDGYFGKHCSVRNECESSKCSEKGECHPFHDETELQFYFNCTCRDGYDGIDCSEKLTITGEDDTSLVLMILIPVMSLFIICLLIGAIIFLRIAKKKRATRGTYSPSRQEMFGSRVEMNHVMKPPPEERLI